MLPAIWGALGRVFWRPALAPVSVWAPFTSGSWVPNHSHHKPGRLPRQAPQGKGPCAGVGNQWDWAWRMAGLRIVLSWWPATTRTTALVGDHFHGAGWGVGEVLSPVESCQHHGYLFPLSSAKVPFLRVSMQWVPWRQMACVSTSAVHTAPEWAWAGCSTPPCLSFLIYKMEVLVELNLEVRIQ